MKVVVCGLGYVGATVAACLLQDGHSVTGIDVSVEKASAVNTGQSPIREPMVGNLLEAGYRDRRLNGRTEIADTLADHDLAILCVGTPSRPNGDLDLSQVLRLAEQVGQAVRARSSSREPLLLVFRSTMLPGSMDKWVVPTLIRAAGEPPGEKYEIAYNPEFLREGSAVRDYYTPPKIIIGERTAGITAKLRGLYDTLNAPIYEVSFKIAEAVKYTDNSFHALKVVFANEIGRFAISEDIDPQQLMEIFLSDRKLNISTSYLRPGGPFGGSCLPKDIRALTAAFRANGMSAPLLDALLVSNTAHSAFLLDLVSARVDPGAHILMCGLTFKADTDDLRESPFIELAERLKGKGYRLSIYEPDLDEAALVGANLKYARERLPHLSSALVPDLDAAAADADLILLCKSIGQHRPKLPSNKPILDIDRLKTDLSSSAKSHIRNG